LIWAKSCPVLEGVSLSSEQRQDYDSDRSADDSSFNDDRSEPRSNTSNPHRSSDVSMPSQSDSDRSNDRGRSDTHRSKVSTPISETRDNPWTDGIPLPAFYADESWGGINENTPTYSPHAGLGAST